MSHPTSLEWEPNSYIRDVESFDVRKTYAGERAPWPLILHLLPDCFLGQAQSLLIFVIQ